MPTSNSRSNQNSLVTPKRIAQMSLTLEMSEEPFAVLREPLARCFDQALSEWLSINKCNPGFFAACSPFARARAIHDRARDLAQVALAGMPDVRIVNDTDLFLIIFQNKFVIRLAKLNNDNVACQNRTHRSQYFYRAQMTRAFPDFVPDMIGLVFGYKLDASETQIAEVYFTLQYKNTVSWQSSGSSMSVAPPAISEVSQPERRTATRISARPVKRRLDDVDENHKKTK